MSRVGRPPLPLGSHGEISYEHVGPSRYLARARYRRSDGKTIRVSRTGQTKGDARNRLLSALTDGQVGGDLTDRTKVAVLVERWLEEITASDRRPQTVQAYRTPAKHITTRAGDLRAGELSPGRCADLLRAVKTEQGPSAARNVRKALNGVCGLAVRHGILPTNPVRETEPISSEVKRVRALTPAEVEDLTDKLRGDERAGVLDLPDLIDIGLATGCRLGELLAIRDGAFDEDGDPVLDLDAGTVEINATVIRVKGNGLAIQHRPKTAAGWRVLALPPYAIELLRGRRERLEYRAPEGAVFGHPHRPALRDQSRVAEALREVLPRLGYGWVHSHILRKTVATRLDEAGLTAREIADQLGHAKPSMTLDVYMGRRVVSARAAEALDR